MPELETKAILDSVDGKIFTREVNGQKTKIAVATVDGQKVRREIKEDGSLGDELVTISTLGKNKYVTKTHMENQMRTALGLGEGAELPSDIKGSYVLIDGSPVLIFKNEDGKTMDQAELREYVNNLKLKSDTPTKDEIPSVSSDNIPQNDANPPKITNIPKSSSLSDIEQTQNMNNRLKTVTDPASGNKYVYDRQGYVSEVYDKDDHRIRTIYASGKYSTYEYDANGRMIRDIVYKENGKVDYFLNHEYDANGRMTRAIVCNGGNGSVNHYTDVEYDADGRTTRDIHYNGSGVVEYFADHEYDADGRETRAIVYNENGAVVNIHNFEYDENGRKTSK